MIGTTDGTDLRAPATGAQFLAFRLSTDLYGIDVVFVQEVLRSHRLARVPLAPPVVAGLINLRGQVVTAIDLRERFGRPPRPDGSDAVAVVVRLHGEVVSLLVDSVVDVVRVDDRNFSPPPETLDGPARDLIGGAYKLPDGLLLALDVEKAVSTA